MTKMNTAAGMPIALTLEPGTYYRCTCGQSQNLPFCDGGHAAGDSLPLQFEITQKKKVFLCSCGNSHNQPFCDDSCEAGAVK